MIEHILSFLLQGSDIVVELMYNWLPLWFT